MKNTVVFFLLFVSCIFSINPDTRTEIITKVPTVKESNIVGLKYDSIAHGPWYISTGSMLFNALYFFKDSIVRLEIQGTAIADLGANGDTLGLIDVFKWVGKVHGIQAMNSYNQPYFIPQKDVEYCDNWYTSGKAECDPGHAFYYTQLQWRQMTLSPLTLEETYVYNWHIGGAVLFYSQTADSLIVGYPDVGTPPGWPTDYYLYTSKEPVIVRDWKEIWDIF